MRYAWFFERFQHPVPPILKPFMQHWTGDLEGDIDPSLYFRNFADYSFIAWFITKIHWNRNTIFLPTDVIVWTCDLEVSEFSFRTIWHDLRAVVSLTFLMVCTFVEWNLALYYTQQRMTQLCSLQLCLQVVLRRQQPGLTGETWRIVHLHSWDDKLFVIK